MGLKVARDGTVSNDGGQTWHKPSDTEWRIIAEHDLSGPDEPPMVVENASGQPMLERVTMMLFAANPAAYKAWLQKIGYDVRPYGSGYNFAIRKPGESHYRLVDPQGGGMSWGDGYKEFFQDVLDISGDLISGVATGAAFTAGAGAGFFGGGPVGSLVGGAASAAAAGSGIEAAREGIGSLLGAPNNISPSEIATVGAVSGSLPVALKGVGAGARKLGSIIRNEAMEAGAKLTSTRGAANFPPEDVFAARLSQPERVGQKMKSIVEEVKGIRNQMKDDLGIGKPGKVFDEEPIVRQMEESSGAKLNFDDLTSPLKEMLKKETTVADLPAGVQATLAKSPKGAVETVMMPQSFESGLQHTASSSLNKQIANMLDESYLAIASSGEDSAALSAPRIRQIMQRLDDLIENKSGYAGEPVTETWTGLLKEFRGTLNEALANAVDPKAGVDPVFGKTYKQLMASLSYKMAQRDYWSGAMGLYEKVEGEGVKKGASFVRNLFNETNYGLMDMVKNYKATFGFDLEIPIRRAFVSAKFGNVGAAPMMAKSPGVGILGRMASVATSVTPLNPRFVTGAMKTATGQGRITGPVVNLLADAAQSQFGQQTLKVIGSNTASNATRMALISAAQDLARRTSTPATMPPELP